MVTPVVVPKSSNVDNITIQKNVSGEIEIIDPNYMPLGSVIPWTKTLVGMSVPTGWAECNGQVLDDVLSPLHNTTLPDLNGNNSFLRGNSSSGGTGGTLVHSHTLNNLNLKAVASGSGANVVDIAAGTSETASNIPPYYNVVYIIKIYTTPVGGSDNTSLNNSKVCVSLNGDGDYNCDGVDDDIQIQAAIDFLESNSGGIVELGAGTFNLSQKLDLYGAKTILIVGSGILSTVLSASTAIDVIEMGHSNSKNYSGCGVQNLQILGDGVNVLTGLKITNLWYCSNKNIRISGCNKGYEILGDGPGAAAALNHLSDYTIHNCTYGVYMDAINGINSVSPFNNGNMFTNGYIRTCNTDVYINRTPQASNIGGECGHHKFTNSYIEISNASHKIIDIKNATNNSFSNCSYDGTGGTEIYLDATADSNYLQGAFDCGVSNLGAGNLFVGNDGKGVFGDWNFTGGILSDTIDESSTGVGVTIDGALLQDGGGSFTSQVKLNNVDANPFKMRRFTSDDQMHEIDIGDENITFTYTQDSDANAQHFYIFDVVSASTGGGGYFFKENSTTLLKLEKSLNKCYVDLDMNSKDILNVNNVPLISTGTAVPTTTPSKIGDEFIDTTNKKIYKATGTSSSADWTILN